MTPTSQADLATLVSQTGHHQIRCGYKHRFIDLMFVNVGDRVFCRRYQYTEPSWYSAFADHPGGQVDLDGTVVNITGNVPADLDAINPAVNEAYRVALEQRNASYLLPGAVEPRALASTFEITFDERPESP